MFMYLAQLDEADRLVTVFNNTQYIEQGVKLVNMPEDTFKLVWESGSHGDWKYLNGQFFYDPLPVPDLIAAVSFTDSVNAGMPYANIPTVTL